MIVNEHWAVSLDILGGQTDFNSTGMQLALSESAFEIGSNLNVEYNLKCRIQDEGQNSIDDNWFLPD